MPTFALAGTGAMAAVWARCIEAVPGHDLVAVASRDRTRAAGMVRADTVPVIGPDGLPAGAEVVVVAGAPADHRGDALTAVEHGAAAVIEAPLCRTLVEADDLVEVAERGARLAYAENLLFSPLVRDALHRISGLGPVHYLEARALQPHNPARRTRTSEWGGGALFELGPHLLAVVLVAAGSDRPVAVRAELERPRSGDLRAVDDRARVELRLASGARAVLEAGHRTDQAQWDLQVATATSALRLELLPDPHLEQLGVDLPRPPRRRPDVEPAQLEQFGYLDQAAEIGADLVAGGRGPWLTMAFGRSVLDIVCAAYRSAATGTEERLPFEGPRTATPWELWRTGGTGSAQEGGRQ